MTTLPLSAFADVTYNLPGIGAPRLGFDLGLVIDTSEVIDEEDRVVVYASLEEMTDAGFSVLSDAYLAATRYFAATSRPSQIAIGRQLSGETALQAITACRSANTNWYLAYIPGADDEDHLDVAAYIETLNSPYSQYFIQSSDSDVLNDTSNNLFAQLKDQDYMRTHGMYSTSAHAVAGIMGYAMGQTSDFVGSAYTLKFKTIPGASTENLTTQQVLNIEGQNGNVYVNRGSFYNVYENGRQFSGDWFDEIIYLDKLANEIQTNVATLLYQTPKIPQTEDGMAQLRAVVADACQNLVSIGFIAEGRWNGLPILTLNTGDYLPGGFVVMSDPIDGQSQTDRDNRIAPNIYVAVKLAGAIQTVFIQINVNR